MVLERDGYWRGCGACQLRIEGADEAIRALRGVARARVEQAEIARIAHLDDAVFQPFDCPAEQLIERHRLTEIEALQFLAKRGDIHTRGDGARLHAQRGRQQLTREPIIDPAPI
jgi:hypothetical protein